MQELVEFIARSLVDDPTQVRVTQYRRGSQVILSLHVAKEDMGRVIGRSGGENPVTPERQRCLE